MEERENAIFIISHAAAAAAAAKSLSRGLLGTS